MDVLSEIPGQKQTQILESISIFINHPQYKWKENSSTLFIDKLETQEELNRDFIEVLWNSCTRFSIESQTALNLFNVLMLSSTEWSTVTYVNYFLQ